MTINLWKTGRGPTPEMAYITNILQSVYTELIPSASEITLTLKEQQAQSIKACRMKQTVLQGQPMTTINVI